MLSRVSTREKIYTAYRVLQGCFSFDVVQYVGGYASPSTVPSFSCMCHSKVK